MNKTDIFDVVLKNNVDIKKSGGVYAFSTDTCVMMVKSEFQPILHTLYSGACSSEILLAALADNGNNEVSANLILAQFLMDCVSYIE